MDNVKTRARWAAGVILDEIPEFSGCIGRICEDLESSSKTYEAADFRKVSWATLVGAARAAARLKGRYDAETDSVTAVQIVPRPLLFIENRMGPIYKDSAMGALGLPDAILDSVKEYSTHLGDTYLVVILAKWRGEWVTWMVNTRESCAFWGHYFKTHKEALTDYHNRGAK